MAAEPADTAAWVVIASMTAWCDTCGTDVEFAVPGGAMANGAVPGDLAVDERGCVWCGEALVVGAALRAVDRQSAPAA